MQRKNSLNDFDMGKHFIFTQPLKLNDLDMDELPDSRDFMWKEKARRLQARRWRKIKQQINVE